METSNVALLVDHDNMSGSSGGREHFMPKRYKLGKLVQLAMEFGHIKVARLYTPRRRNQNLAPLEHYSRGWGVDVVPTDFINGKSLVDPTMVLDCLKLHYEDDIDTFVVCSGDKDFLPVIEFLQSRNKRVIVVARNGSGADVLVQATNNKRGQAVGSQFHYYEILGKVLAPEGESQEGNIGMAMVSEET